MCWSNINAANGKKFKSWDSFYMTYLYLKFQSKYPSLIETMSGNCELLELVQQNNSAQKYPTETTLELVLHTVMVYL